jgi:hypothetical protein
MSNLLLRTLQELMGNKRPLWRDYSYWQQEVDFDLIKKNNVQGMIARSSIGYREDNFFERNWKEAKKINIYRTSYHYLYPNYDIDKQLDVWFEVHPAIDILPRVIDVESDKGMPSHLIASQLWYMSEKIKEHDGFRPIIYTRKLFINPIIEYWTKDKINSHYWWLAQYLWDRSVEHPGPPSLPNRLDRDRVILHQTADKKEEFIGKNGEEESAGSISVDWNRWELGNEYQMHKWIKNTFGKSLFNPVFNNNQNNYWQT